MVCQVINFIKQILGNNESVHIDLVVINLIVGVRGHLAKCKGSMVLIIWTLLYCIMKSKRERVCVKFIFTN